MNLTIYEMRLRPFLFAILVLSFAPTAAAQAPPVKQVAANMQVSDSLDELKSEVRELKGMVLQLQQQTTDSRSEIAHLRQELEASRSSADGRSAIGADDSSAKDGGTSDLAHRVGDLEDNEQLLTGKVNEQYQTKVESASKYRVRFSGTVLFNLFGNSGSVDNQDVPSMAVDKLPLSSSGSIGGTLRQSILGFEVFGPEVMGARTSGNINLDFGGGFPDTYNGVNAGLVRLRTAAVRLDWKNTSLIGGQDQLFISPNSPTSYASLIVPAFSYAGNLWGWTPQIRVEHRFALSNDGAVMVQGGLLDPLTGEPPYYQWYRIPQAGEYSRQPAYAARVAYSHPLAGHTFTVGAAGYYSRQNWGYNRDVNGWAGTVDWNVPLDRWFTLTGSFYRGAAIGGLGGGIGRSVLYSGPLTDPTSAVLPLNTVGGWAQVKFRPGAKLEFNVGFGQDNPFAADLRAFPYPQSYGDPTLGRNRGIFGNVIYRPRSDLLFSLEYRHLHTFTIASPGYQAGQVNLSMGVLF
jgi:hypothetical protein